MFHTPKKSLGQNFLMHQATADRIAEAAGIGKEDAVLEIGPGHGKLTRALLALAKKVVAIETDTVLVTELQTTFATEIAAGKLELVQGDVREFDPRSIAGPYLLVANIPYYITGEIIRSFLSAAHKPSSMTLLVQKEVAERIARDPKESILSLSIKAYGTPAYRFTVPRGAFVPAPSVDSAVLSVTGIRPGFSSTAEEERFFTLMKAGFAHKRKRLAGNLSSLASKEALETAFTKLGIGKDVRAEDLSIDVWRALTRELS